jgi:hypothetical protein
MFVPGSQPYVGEMSGIDGVYVWYQDENLTIWQSDYGSGDQTGSTFNIVETIVLPGASSSSRQNHLISAAEFSCKVYDGNGNSKTITNCILRGPCCEY